MKFKRTVLLATFVVTMGLLLGTSAAQATEVILDGDGNVLQILDLPIDDGGKTTVYDVDFIYDTAEVVYGPDLEFDFPPPGELILVARTAVNHALNNHDPTPVGAGPQGTIDYFIGNVEQLNIVVAAGGELIEGVWGRCKGDQCISIGESNIGFAIVGPNEMVTFADFTEVTGPPPDPVTIGGTVSGLEGSGLVLQNNESDDEPIAADGEFTFDTPLTPGTSYNVSVKTQPSNPSQTCSVANGSGLVPTEDVTNVAVTCGEPVLADVFKVAAEGDTLPDTTVLKNILLDGGVAINLDGQVAFGGRDGDGIDAVFTQAGKVVAEGDTLVDGTILAAFRGQGEVAISAGQSGDRVAFHGQAETGLTDTAAVFTQAGQVAAVGDEISTGITVDDIDPHGKVAINNFNQVAFHGRVLQVASKRRAVFTSDGLEEPQVVAQEATNLPDETYLVNITESGGVAISDFDEVAFHGQTVNPEPGGDSLKAVFTSDGLAAKEGTDLDDGTILDDINENGGVAINLFGDVAFHGDAIDPEAGGDSVKAVFTQAGRVAKEGDILPGGTTLDEIEVNGGVAINIFGEVAFHGRTGGVKAVFISDGQTIQVVAKVGDNVDDGTTLSEINNTAGVAITPYGSEVAFHGKVGTTDAVFVGSPPPPPPPTNVVQVFITGSEYRGGELEGLAGADAHCQEDAEDAGLTGTWRAWLSDINLDARDRIPDGQYQLVDGTVIADNKDDLTDGFLNAPISLNERGEEDVGFVWTGTSPDGTGAEDNCDNWTNDLEEADFGFSDETGRRWTSYVATGDAPTSCNQGDFKLYCFGGGQ
jgi:hypothetical protein